MKRDNFAIIVSVIVVCHLSVVGMICARAQTIDFQMHNEPWEVIIKKAQSLNKPIFVDVFTDWCGPCKWMDIHVFNQSSVISFVDANFLAIKINGEKGHGIDFVDRHRINSYPSYLFFSPDGDLLLSGMGSTPIDDFNKMAGQALENLKKGISLEAMQAQVKYGTPSPEFIAKYIRKLSAHHQPNALMIEYYLQTIPEDSLYTPQVLSLVKLGYFGRMPVDGKAFRVLLRGYAHYPVKSWELMSPWNSIRNRLLDYVDSAGRSQDTLWLREILLANSRLNENDDVADRETFYFLCRYHANANDSLNFVKYANAFADRFVMDVNEDSLYRMDSVLFAEALKLKFGTDLKSKIPQNDYLNFQKTFYSEARIIDDETLHISVLYRTHFPSGFAIDIDTKIANWLSRSIGFYKNNPIYMNNEYLEFKLKQREKLINE